MEKYERNGHIAVLVSPGYGAGWSTWNASELAYDKRVVEFYLQIKDKNLSNEELTKAFKDMGYEHVYFGGYDQLYIEWIPKGTKFFIDEYDGYESIKYVNSYDWQEA